MNTQDGSGLWGYHDDAKSLCFQKPVDIKKVDAKNNLIFKYIVENIRLKKIIPNFWQIKRFLEIEPREGTTICTESLSSV